MKLSEFTDYKFIGDDIKGKACFASVNVTTGHLWWKKKFKKQIFKSRFSSFWQFLDTGEFTPGFQAINLEDSYLAQEQLRQSSTDEAGTLKEKS